MPEDTTTVNAIVIIVITNVLTAVGAWFTARAEKPTGALVEIIGELRKENAILLKKKIELESSVQEEKQLKREERNIKNQYIVRAEQLERILQRHHIPVPEMEGNGTTPDHKKAEGK